METKICPFSNQNFSPSRSNQVYINSKIRIKANNLKAKKVRQSISYIDTPLKTNFKKLNELLKQKNEVVLNRQYILGYGINLSLHTHVAEIDGNKRFFIYNFGIVPLENEQIKIIKYDTN